MNFTTIDIIFLILIGVMSFRGLFNGIIKELFSLGALVCGILAAMAFYKTLAQFFTEQFGSHAWNTGLAFFLVFIVIFIGLKVLERIVLKMMEETAAFSIDKGLGFLLGLFEGIIICSLLTYFLGIQTLFNTDKMILNSLFIPFLSKVFPFLESTSSAMLNSIKK